MRKHTYPESVDTARDAHLATDAPSANGGLPNRLMTAFEVAEFIGCHEETVRRAYLRGLLVSQRFGVREEGGSVLKMSSTGFVEALRLEFRKHKGGSLWPFENGVAAVAAKPA